MCHLSILLQSSQYCAEGRSELNGICCPLFIVASAVPQWHLSRQASQPLSGQVRDVMSGLRCHVMSLGSRALQGVMLILQGLHGSILIRS
mmetsp:Transcript_7418/g.12811  ORF Transcript_7418/g.12811 Transcript_7418/m.12811 type:complete len:90 (-) Transcript_7418:1013-1282(-)